jgi:transcription initiation factor TFIIB
VLAPDRAWEEARRVCCEVVRNRYLPTKSLQIVAATSLYAACREFNAPVTIADLAEATRAKGVEIGRSYRLIVDRVGLTPPPPNGTRYALKVASVMGISKEATALALEIEKCAVNKGLEVRKPMTIAAASTYLACLAKGEAVTQSDVADASGTSVVSVRECSRAIRSLVQASGLLGAE